MARIDLDSVTLTYDGGGGVRSVSLGIGDGEYVALLGPSGSGKTTLLRLVAGFLRPDSGSVSIDSKTVADEKTFVPPEKRNLGMVFQQHAVWPHMSVAKNVEYPLARSKTATDEREERVREVLDLVGLGDYSTRAPDTLSGGQQQRVALARALVADPEALLLDEPFASLDAALKERLRVELGALASRTTSTVIHVTHDREEALGLADRVVVMRDGAVEQVATPRELLASPATPFVAGFVADASLVSVEMRGGRLFDEDGSEIEIADLKGGDTGDASGVLALRPGDVEVSEGDGATVKTTLYAGDSVRVYLNWRGLELRATTDAGTTLATGDRVRPALLRGMFFENT